MTALPARGEVWWCEMAEIGRRPVVVLSRDAAIPRLRRALVAPCTTTIRGLASEVVLEPGSDPIPRRSAVNLDSVESVSVAVLVNRLGRLADIRMHLHGPRGRRRLLSMTRQQTSENPSRSSDERIRTAPWLNEQDGSRPSSL